MKRLSFAIFALALSFQSFAQSYAFEPSNEYSGIANLEEYNIYQVYMINTSPDTLWLTWRLTENTIPEDWEITLCDNVACYGTLPNTADMDPVFVADSAFLKLDINPGTIDGAGILKFRIYETGTPNYEELTFHVTTDPTSLNENVRIQTKVYPNPSHNFLNISNLESTALDYTIFDGQGKQVLASSISANAEFTIQVIDWPSGQYFLVLNNEGIRTSTRFIVSH